MNRFSWQYQGCSLSNYQPILLICKSIAFWYQNITGFIQILLWISKKKILPKNLWAKIQGGTPTSHGGLCEPSRTPQYWVIHGRSLVAPRGFHGTQVGKRRQAFMSNGFLSKHQPHFIRKNQSGQLFWISQYQRVVLAVQSNPNIKAFCLPIVLS